MLKVTNRISRATGRSAAYLYRYLYVLYSSGSRSANRFFCHVMILTIDFDCSLHTDTCDQDKPSEEKIISQLDDVICSPITNRSNKIEAEKSKKFIATWGFGHPTTCLYQFVFDESEVNPNDVQIIQYFCLFGFGICYPIRHLWVHCFLSYCFSHFTSTPLFIINGVIYLANIKGFQFLHGEQLGVN